MYHYTYMLKALNPLSAEVYYIGVRSSKNKPDIDNYFSSSKYVSDAIKNGVLFDKIVLGIFDSREEAVLNEIELHNFYDVGANDTFFNKSKQTSIGFDTSGVKIPKERIEKIKKAQKDLFSDPEYREYRRKIQADITSRESWRKNNSEAQKIAQNRPEVKEKMSKSVKKALSDPKVRKKISENTKKALSDPSIRKKISDAGKGRVVSKKIMDRMLYDNPMNNPESRAKISMKAKERARLKREQRGML